MACEVYEQADGIRELGVGINTSRSRAHAASARW
jgi:hypothetical protein